MTLAEPYVPYVMNLSPFSICTSQCEQLSCWSLPGISKTERRTRQARSVGAGPGRGKARTAGILSDLLWCAWRMNSSRRPELLAVVTHFIDQCRGESGVDDGTIATHGAITSQLERIARLNMNAVRNTCLLVTRSIGSAKLDGIPVGCCGVIAKNT